MVRKHKQDAVVNDIAERALVLGEILWVVLAERRVILIEARAPMLIEGDKCEDGVPPPNEVIGEFLAVDTDSEDD